MIHEICGCDSYTRDNGLSNSEQQPRDLTNFFQAASESIKLSSPLKPLMAGCTRDIEIKVFYEDKYGNKYGATVGVSGGETPSDGDDHVSVCDEGPDR